MSRGSGLPRRPRLGADEREAMVVAGAIRVVAAQGFDLSVRALGRQIGVPHSVLFRFFPSKEALLRRLFDEVFASRLRPEWPVLLADASRPPRDRLAAFYRDYTEAIFDEVWVRLFLFAGLKGTTLNADYFRVLGAQVLEPVAAALAPELPPAQRIERAWALHGRIFYLAIRRFVYRRPVPDCLTPVLVDAIDAALAAARTVAVQTADPGPPRPAIEATAPHALAPPPPDAARRMSPEARARSIVDGAIVFFARYGIGAQMRELARHLGIAHSLLFHYFPRKQDLVEQVVAEVFGGPWQGDGLRGLRDAATPLRTRLTTFYETYLAVVDRAEWVRIFISAGLADEGFSGRYLDRVETEIIDVIAAAARQFVGAEGDADSLREDAWGLHGEIVYRAIRHHIYAAPATISRAETVRVAVSSFLAALAIRRRGADCGSRPPG